MRDTVECGRGVRGCSVAVDNASEHVDPDDPCDNTDNCSRPCSYEKTHTGTTPLLRRPSAGPLLTGSCIKPCGEAGSMRCTRWTRLSRSVCVWCPRRGPMWLTSGGVTSAASRCGGCECGVVRFSSSLVAENLVGFCNRSEHRPVPSRIRMMLFRKMAVGGLDDADVCPRVDPEGGVESGRCCHI